MSCKSTDEFKYFVINTESRWKEGFADSIDISAAGLKLASFSNNTFPDIGHATGLTLDQQNNLFILDAQFCRIYQYNIATQTLKNLTCSDRCTILNGQFTCKDDLDKLWEDRSLFSPGHEPGEFSLMDAQGQFSGGIAVSRSTLIVADTFNHRIQAFYIPSFQIRFLVGKNENYQSQAGDAESEFDCPKDVAADSHGNFYVLDYGNRRIQQFNFFGQFMRVFGNSGPHQLQRPEALAIDTVDRIYIADAERKTIERFDKKGKWLDTPVSFADYGISSPPSAVAVDNENTIHVGVTDSGDDLAIHIFTANGVYQGHVGTYDKTCCKLLSDKHRRLFCIVGQEGRISIRGERGQSGQNGAYYSKRFDSTIQNCVWHRINIELEHADKAGLHVFYHASNDIVSRSEIDAKTAWTELLRSPHNTTIIRDALFRGPAGRYLQIKFAFSGDGLSTYTVKNIRVFFERLSYLRYLPATFQEDEESRDFLERFLSIFETLSFDIEQHINGMAHYFDPMSVDEEFLAWLSSWLAVTQDQNWPLAKRQNVLQQAFQLYKIRGTTQGFLRMLRIFTERDIAIVEHFRFNTPMILGKNTHIGGWNVVGHNSANPLVLEETSTIGAFQLEAQDSPTVPFEINAFDFSVLADTSGLENQAQVDALQRLIDAEKPAHTRCFLRKRDGFMQLGVHATLQVDTTLSAGYQTTRLGEMSNDNNNLFIGSKFSNKGAVATRSKIEIDAVLH